MSIRDTSDTNQKPASNVRSHLPAYGRIPKELLRDADISPNAKLVYGMLDEVAGFEHCTMAKLTEWLGFTHERTASRAVHELADRGWIKITEKYVAARQMANEYLLYATAQAPHPDSGVTQGPDSGVRQVTDSGVTPSTETSYETKNETNTQARDTTDEQPALALVPSLPSSPDQFDEFWKAYPKRSGSKQAARKAWKAAIKKEKPRVIIEHAAAFAKCGDLPEERFRPHAATWLNQERWRDAVSQPRSSRPEKPDGACSSGGCRYPAVERGLCPGHLELRQSLERDGYA